MEQRAIIGLGALAVAGLLFALASHASRKKTRRGLRVACYLVSSLAFIAALAISPHIT